MRKNSDFLDNLCSDVEKLDYIINNYKKYNFEIGIKKLLLKGGKKVYCLLPFLTTGTILFNFFNLFNNTPFVIDKINKKSQVLSLCTSTGIWNKKVSFDYDYSSRDEFFQWSTGWVKNEYGLYERIVTSYNYKDLDKIDDIFNVTKDEIEDLVEIVNVKKIQKSILDESDMIYDRDMVIFTDVCYGDNQKAINESDFRNIFISILYIFLVLGLPGVWVAFRKKVLKKDSFVISKIDSENEKLVFVDNLDIIKYKYIYNIRKSNYDLFNESTINDNSEVKRINRKFDR